MDGMCPRCGAPNQHGTFCQQCGAPLTPAGSPPISAGQPGPGMLPPAQGVPPGYQPPAQGAPGYGPISPYSGAQPPHRLPLASILGVTIGLLGVIAAVAIVFGHHGAAAQPPYPPLSTVAPSSTVVAGANATAQPTSTQASGAQATGTIAPVSTTAALPTSTFAAQPTEVTQPTEVVPPTEIVQPTQPAVEPTVPAGQPTQVNQGPSQSLTTTTFTVQVPTSWQVVNQKTGQTQNEVVLEDPSTAPNSLDIFAGQSSASTTAQAALQTVLGNLQQQYPDAKVCGNSQQATIGGIAGTAVPICFTFTPQGGTAVSSADVAWAGTDQSGSNLYVAGMMAGQSNQAFFSNAAAVLQTVQWVGGQ